MTGYEYVDRPVGEHVDEDVRQHVDEAAKQHVDEHVIKVDAGDERRGQDLHRRAPGGPCPT
ncbi:hypothetical protein ABT010_36000 [Streptomyces sp. NPDC002668]|uniref:hypothetical protein n=1 Tax=Streptomyces sp. NPDC002668 TaxID=3154422 RepID=UPI00331E1A0B